MVNNPHIQLQTKLGTITVELYPQQAPITVRNFLKYIKENRFKDAKFYRVVRMDNQPNNNTKIEVIQGGLKDDDHSLSLPTIPHETTQQTGILHKDGTISMARNEPGTASSEFFICINDHPELDFGGTRNPDGQGFAAFGKVIAGMDVVKKIQSQPLDGQYLVNEIKFMAILIA
jgi:peptidyl-prolyl cis-trans isomerase A (cyclophilin A)